MLTDKTENFLPMLLFKSFVSKSHYQIIVNSEFLNLRSQLLQYKILSFSSKLLLKEHIITIEFLNLCDYFFGILVTEGLCQPHVRLLSEGLQVVPQLVPHIVFLLEINEFLDFDCWYIKRFLILPVSSELTHGIIKVFLDSDDYSLGVGRVSVRILKLLSRQFLNVLSDLISFLLDFNINLVDVGFLAFGDESITLLK